MAEEISDRLVSQQINFRKEGYSPKAVALVQQALQAAKTHSSPLQTMVLLNDLAGLYILQADVAQAEATLKRALKIAHSELDPQHPLMAQLLSNLAALYLLQGRFTEAEQVQQRALQIIGKALGTDRPEYAQALQGLAAVYLNQGRWKEAEPILKQASELCRQASATESLQFAMILLDQAKTQEAQNQYSEAEKLIRKALNVQEKQLGSDHPEIARSQSQLAEILEQQGDPERAKVLYQQILVSREKTLDSHHPEVVESLWDLANLYAELGEEEKSQTYVYRAMEVEKNIKGLDPARWAKEWSSLAQVYQRQGKPQEAKKFYQKTLSALARRDDGAASSHPEVAVVLTQLASWYQEQKEYAAAETVLRRATHLKEQIAGQDSAKAVVKLAPEALEELGPDSSAQEVSEGVVISRDFMLDLGQSNDVAAGRFRAILRQAVESLVQEKQFLLSPRSDFTEVLFKKVLKIYEETFGPNHPEMAVALDTYATWLEKMGRLSEARSMKERAARLRSSS